MRPSGHTPARSSASSVYDSPGECSGVAMRVWHANCNTPSQGIWRHFQAHLCCSDTSSLITVGVPLSAACLMGHGGGHLSAIHIHVPQGCKRSQCCLSIQNIHSWPRWTKL
eukprot:2656831-Amphidinium_carterae.1